MAEAWLTCIAHVIFNVLHSPPLPILSLMLGKSWPCITGFNYCFTGKIGKRSASWMVLSKIAKMNQEGLLLINLYHLLGLCGHAGSWSMCPGQPTLISNYPWAFCTSPLHESCPSPVPSLHRTGATTPQQDPLSHHQHLLTIFHKLDIHVLIICVFRLLTSQIC